MRFVLHRTALAAALCALPALAAEPPPAAAAPRTAASAPLPDAPESPAERAAVHAIGEGKYVRARELAERILRDDPRSAVAEMVLARALHDGEGNSPLALAHFLKAQALIERPGGTARPGHEKRHRELLFLLSWALSDVGRFADALAVNARIRTLYDPELRGIDVWPLMKLGREDEARAAAARGIASGRAVEEVMARNGLCALDGYPACLEALAAVRRWNLDTGLALRNAAVSAADAGRYDESERLLLESADNPDEDVNPWRDLASLYASEGRLAESVDAARRMETFSRRLPRRVRQHSRAVELYTSAQVLLLAGHPDRARAASERALAEPDRAAHWSGSEAETGSGIALLDRAIHRTLAATAAERAALGPWRTAPRDWWSTWSERGRAWLAGRAVTPLLLEGGLERDTRPDDPLRPQLEAPAWLLPDAVALLGPASTRKLVAAWLARGPRPGDATPKALREGLLRALDAEAAYLAGERTACVAAVEQARALLPPAEGLLRVRLAARAAAALWAAGDLDAATPYYAEVMAHDPGLLRRLGEPLPVDLAADAGAAGERALATPRFARAPGSAFVIGGGSGGLCLAGPHGAVLACAGEGRAQDKDAPADPAARLAAALIESAFAPRVGLTQQDLSSLDGSAVAERGITADALDVLTPQGPPP